MDSALLSLLKKRVIEQQQSAVDGITAGHMKDFTEYRYSCGYLKGLNDAVLLAEQILLELEKGK